MAKETDNYAKFPLRKISDIQQIYSERNRFIATLLEVLLLGGLINFTTSAFFLLINETVPEQKIWHLIQFTAGAFLSIILFIIIVKVVIFKPIELRTSFYTGILVKEGTGKTVLIYNNQSKNANNIQQKIFDLTEQNKLMKAKNTLEVGELIQFAFFHWYENVFWNNWLPGATFTSVGSTQTFEIEGIEKALLSVPENVQGAENNFVFSQNLYPSFQISVPKGTKLSISKGYLKSSPSPSLPENLQIKFQRRNSFTVEIRIDISGYGMLKGREGLFKSDFSLPSNTDGWYFYDYRLSVDTQFPEPFTLRLGLSRHSPKLEHYYLWARQIIEGLEKDFCYPFEFREQYYDQILKK